MFFFFSSRRRHTRCLSDWSSDVCSSDLEAATRAQARFEGRPAERLAEDLNPEPQPSERPRQVDRAKRAVGLPQLDAGDPEQIGRASCREREKMTGDAGAVEKKKQDDAEG